MLTDRVALAAMTLAEKAQGRCGDKCQAFVDFMRTLGCEARQWGFMFEGDGPETHVVAEVRIGEQWRVYDVHWRTTWLAVPDPAYPTTGHTASLDEVLTGVTHRLHHYAFLQQHPELQDGRDPYAYLTGFTRKWVLYYENSETGERHDA